MTNDDWQAAMAELEAENAKLRKALTEMREILITFSGVKLPPIVVLDQANKSRDVLFQNNTLAR